MKTKIEIRSPKGPAEIISLELVKVEGQESILEWVESNTTKVNYGCRVGSCGTCMIEVIGGAEYLEERTPQEADTLDRMNRSANTRLACRAKIKPDADGLIQVKTVF